LHLDALSRENDLREILVLDLEENIKVFSALNVDTLTHAQLKHWAIWTSAVESKLEHAAQAVESGRALLTAENLGPLAALLEGDEDRALFKAYLKSLSED
jgi:hypothetical protein